jgi:hypothetical protein
MRIHVHCRAALLVATVLQACPEQCRHEQQNGTLGGSVLFSVHMKLVQSEIQTAKRIRESSRGLRIEDGGFNS